MATSKLLKPTNVTISIPAFTDQPDQRVNSNCIDKEADAINSLSDQIGTLNSNLANKMTKPTNSGTQGQLLQNDGNGGSEWANVGTPSDSQVGTAVSAWLTAHPEATTTVQDGAITRAKLDADLKEKTDAVSDLKSAITSKMILRKSLNLFNKDAVLANHFIGTDGTEYESTTYSASDYIEVEEGETYSFCYSTGSGITALSSRFLTAYDATKTAVSASGGTYLSSYTVPSGIKWIRISAESGTFVTTMVLKGSTLPAYFIPYFEPYYTADDEFLVGTAVDDLIAEAEMSKDFREDVSRLYDEYTETIPSVTYTDGFWWGGQAHSGNFVYTNKITVDEGDVITSVLNGNDSGMRFIEAYDSQNNIVGAASKNTHTSRYIVPAGVESVIITAYSNQAIIYVQKLIGNTYEILVKDDCLCFREDYDLVSANTDYVIANYVDNKKNCEYCFFGKFASFSSLTIGHGKTEYGGIYMTISPTKITIYNYEGSQYQEFTHGLTFNDFISCTIKVADTATARATVTIQTNGGIYSTGNVIFFGCNGSVFFYTGASMTDVSFVYNIMDAKKDVFLFGDSYISLADDNRWPKYAIENGDNNMLLCGFGGATSTNEILCFRQILSRITPKVVVWALGMNNADSSGINVTWKRAVEEVISVCESKGITLILATIPNTPIVDNTYKNAYVKASGLRYVDFARAVGAESANASWYTGMLSGDNVHPTAIGAKALWARIALDVPEIMERTI